MPAISKQKLLERDTLEVLRFAFYIDPERVKQQFLSIGILINNENDIKNFTQGLTPFGSKHNYDVRHFVNNVTFRHSLAESANIELI